ncbi:MAG: DUF3820 family protein [Bacteroidia bacterium]|nr:DUF3820 family protein [Bacteroidia bacterium]
MQQPGLPNPQILMQLVTTKMPFGKYKGTLLCDIPVFYLEWFNRKGFPKGSLGMLLSTIYEIKLNGLEELIAPLKKIAREENR